ncbi:hypothetical protein [Mycobacteroides abscessus]|uniref:hypothetical protein n=1 Tax=Mycobacteroides abscessus TaxID=36809 RepID=UPI00092735A1|nr:hypothetical protein [Mycobacteroides abscessus]SHP98899.1 Uncharacterised protein [Mycobacteroides abscessus subsp. abscessus]SHQ61496.1 Uncharacterised protein [Mycobacteroides abscessus subsp. abscessus]SKD62987.1 Uncharacterised protein [Mycobacteroides abscessus subsp. abscessus]SLD63238.1 Uncharacterised protein [Mycobacteroides abscessus subsp. abscessus]
MTARVKTAALTLAALTALAGTGILVHGVGAEPRQDGQSVTSPASSAPRTVVMAAPAPGEPLCLEMKAICAPIPPKPLSSLEVSVPEVPKTDAANEYTRAWEEALR